MDAFYRPTPTCPTSRSTYGTKQIVPTTREANCTLDELLGNETDLPIHEHATDTHGATLVNFGLFDLVGKSLTPRIRDLGKITMLRVDDPNTTNTLYPHTGPLLADRWNEDLIAGTWDDMLRMVVVALAAAWWRLPGVVHRVQRDAGQPGPVGSGVRQDLPQGSGRLAADQGEVLRSRGGSGATNKPSISAHSAKRRSHRAPGRASTRVLHDSFVTDTPKSERRAQDDAASPVRRGRASRRRRGWPFRQPGRLPRSLHGRWSTG
ncbi:Tn3 transposase DDE domain-containing protein [Actinocorallia herbida]|uniref:Tn3 transposase DDE domain-containing protein n=1 Tax=Actinocorallia herbida TaxID=58109 RepID=A0A3N1CYQ3_9ACTN|nr:transposase [Actinocorallia herbida]ROO86411.1 Tn3 transposase DDE domain-containing protein [Actinocorallia herbida]